MTLAVSLLVAVVCCSMSQEAPKPQPFLMFFTKGDGTRPQGEELTAVTQSHFANMAAQAEAGRLFAAGPLADPTEVRRGITVVTANDRNEVPKLFTADQFVQRGIMKVEAAPWDVDLAKFDPKVDPGSIAEHRLVLWRRGMGMSPETPAMHESHRTLINGMAASHGLAVWGTLGPSEDPTFAKVSEAAIFVGKDTAGIEEALAKDLMVQRHLLEIEVIPLWMSKGVVKPSGG
ncbi:MAG: YciI family protein [Fimbriimonadaceae bacterium]